jgi:hypothetical protein
MRRANPEPEAGGPEPRRGIYAGWLKALWIAPKALDFYRFARKIWVDPLICPRCGGRMKVIAFLTDDAVVDRIIGHLKLTFVAERPPPHFVYQEVLVAAEAGAEYFS